MKKIKCICGGDAIERTVSDVNGAGTYDRMEYKCAKCGCRFVTKAQSEANSRAIKDRNITTYYN